MLRKPAKPTVLCIPRQMALGGDVVAYRLRLSGNRRTISFYIDESGMRVHAPLDVPEWRLDALLAERAPWILRKLEEAKSWRKPEPEWRTGDLLPFMGDILRLKIDRAAGLEGARREGERLWVPRYTDVRSSVIEWYRNEARKLFARRIPVYAERLRVAPSEVILSNARTRWGSCSARGVVRLNWRLVKVPRAEADYVIAHELAHLRHLNHSPAFWRTVASVCPSYERLRASLRERYHECHAF